MACTKTNTRDGTKNSYNIMTQQTFRKHILLCFSDFTFAAITEDTFPFLLSSKNMNIKDESSGNFLLFLIISFLKQDLNTFHIKGM